VDWCSEAWFSNDAIFMRYILHQGKQFSNMYITRLWFCHDTYPMKHSYPFNLEIFRKTDSIRFSRPVTFFIGENGSGKTTLLKAIARNRDIHIWEDRQRGRYHVNPYEDLLYRSIRIEGDKIGGSFFASEIFRHFAEILDDWAVADPASLLYFGNSSLLEKSHGQSHMAFFTNRFRIAGLYLLDEPENALSPRMQLELLRLLRQFAARGDAQFIIATHSPILLACPEADILSFDRIPIQEVEYENTDYYRVYKDFLNNRERYLGPL
jgi:predicted ATPase